MPNGGPDNCATCGFNRANSGTWDFHAAVNIVPGYCAIRNLDIDNPHWTYCKNWHTRDPVPAGPLYTSMYASGYQRVPFYLRVQPETGVEATCHVCGDHSDNGIRVTNADLQPEFCSVEHYRIWWDDTMRKWLAGYKQTGEQAYSDMYEASFGRTSGYYSSAKDAFLEAIVIARELELPEEAAALEARLQHIKDTHRSQF